MHLVSIANENNPLDINTGGEFSLYRSESHLQEFQQYHLNAYNLLRAHWLNGVKMFNDHGQHGLANGSSIVCASSHDFDFSSMCDDINNYPDNTIIFNLGVFEYAKHPYTQIPTPYPDIFVCKYSTFMQFTVVWKWLESHRNQPDLFETDTLSDLMFRSAGLRHFNFTYVNTHTLGVDN